MEAVGIDEFAALLQTRGLSKDIAARVMPFLLQFNLEATSVGRSKVIVADRLVENVWQLMVLAIPKWSILNTGEIYQGLAAWIDQEDVLARAMAVVDEAKFIAFLEAAVKAWNKAQAAGAQTSLIQGMLDFFRAVRRSPIADAKLKALLTPEQYLDIIVKKSYNSLAWMLSVLRAGVIDPKAQQEMLVTLNAAFDSRRNLAFATRLFATPFIEAEGIEILLDLKLESAERRTTLASMFSNIALCFKDDEIVRQLEGRKLFAPFVNYFKEHAKGDWIAKGPILKSMLQCLEAWGRADQKVIDQLANDSEFIDRTVQLIITGVANNQIKVAGAAMRLLLKLAVHHEKIADRLTAPDMLAVFNNPATMGARVNELCLPSFILVLSHYKGTRFFVDNIDELREHPELAASFASKAEEYKEAWPFLGLAKGPREASSTPFARTAGAEGASAADRRDDSDSDHERDYTGVRSAGGSGASSAASAAPS